MKSRIKPSVREAREARGLTQAQLSERCGVPQSTISEVERGQNVTLATLAQIGAALGVEFRVLAVKKGVST